MLPEVVMAKILPEADIVHLHQCVGLTPITVEEEATVEDVEVHLALLNPLSQCSRSR